MAYYNEPRNCPMIYSSSRHNFYSQVVSVMAGINFYFVLVLLTSVSINFLVSYTDAVHVTWPYQNDIDKPIVVVQDGGLQGFTMRTVHNRTLAAFQFIPFAEPPVGPLRFKNPRKNKPWGNIRDARPESPQCIQMDLMDNFTVHGQEDCLYLNVYVPMSHLLSKDKTLRPLPVMVYIHGGVFFWGAGSIYGPRYLLDHDIILVTLNYRLGPFGFFSTGDAASPGNQAMKDQVLALRWVKTNIAAFGGNGDAVTIFGNSVGGASVGLHIVSPLSRGLFHRTIWESGSAFNFWTVLPNAPATAQRVGKQFHCPTSSSPEMVECLRNVPAQTLASVQLQFIKWYIYPLLIFAPNVEPDLPDAFLTKPVEQYYADGEAANVTVMAGFTANEMTWAVSVLMKDPALVNDINQDWDRIMPIYLALDYDTPEVQTARVRAIRRFYLGDQDLDWNSRFQFSNIYSARYIVDDTLKGMRYHSLYTRNPIYAYRFSYSGQYSNVQHFGLKAEDWGVCHMNELIYLLNNTDYYGTLERDNKADLQMSSLMTQIWTRFATYGNPNVGIINNGYTTEGSIQANMWHPIAQATNLFSPLRFYDLNLNPSMIEDPYANEYRFWRLVINP